MSTSPAQTPTSAQTPTTSAQTATTAGQLLRTVGKANIYYHIFWLVVTDVIFFMIAVATLCWRRGWSSEIETVQAISCTDVFSRSCTKYNCTVQHKKNCAVTVGSHVLTRTYSSTVPTVGGKVVVYFDPKNRDKTLTLQPFPKEEVLAVCAFVIFICTLGIFVLYKSRNDVRVSTGLLAVDALHNMSARTAPPIYSQSTLYTMT